MRSANRRWVITLGAALVLTICVNSVRAAKPTTIPAWFDDEIVSVIPGVSSNVVGVTNHAIASKAANPLYVVGGQDVDHILGVAIPGAAGYNPFWDIVIVTVLDGRDVSTDPFTSEEEILDAYANGEVDLTDTGFILLCQVISK